MRYFKTPDGCWVSEEEWTNGVKYTNRTDYTLIKQGGYYGQHLPDGSFEDRSDIITIEEE